MDVLLAMQVFRRVVELESFSAAARDLRLSNAAVSKHVAQLEERLGTRLLLRTTRRMSLTTEGEAYYERCARILEDLDETERALTHQHATPRGRLKVNAPLSFGLLHVSPLVPELLARWPEMSLELGLSDRFVDVIEEGVDVVIRIAAELPDSATLAVQRLASADQVVCAAPAYLKRHKAPRRPEDLATHACLVYSGSRTPGTWELEGPDGQVRIEVGGRLVVDNSLAIRDALVAGLGVALIPAFYVAAELADGRLRAVLTDHPARPVHVSAVYQRSRHLSARVRAFIDLLRARFEDAGWARQR